EPEALGGARREVLEEDVGPRRELLEDRARLGPFHVERQAFLGTIGPDEMRGLAVHRVIVGARSIAAAWPLDLDHPGPELGELPRRERAGDHLLQCNDRDAVERP